MSEENVERIRQGIDAFNRRDFDTALALVHEDVSWKRFLSRAEADTPDVRGKEELRTIWESQVEALDIRIDPDEFIAVGDSIVIVPCRMVAHGSGSEIDLSTPVTWMWIIDDDGLATRVEAFETRAEAVAAAASRS